MADLPKPQKARSTESVLKQIETIAHKGDLWDSDFSGFEVGRTLAQECREHAWTKWREFKKWGMLINAVVSIGLALATYFFGVALMSVLKAVSVAVLTFVAGQALLWLGYWLSAPKAINEGLHQDVKAARNQLVEEKRKLRSLAEISKAKIEELKDGYLFQSAANSQVSHMASFLQMKVEIGNGHQCLPTRPMYFEMIVTIKNYSLWPLNIYLVEGRVSFVGGDLFEQPPTVASHFPIQNLTSGHPAGVLVLRQHTSAIEMQKLLSGPIALSFSNATIPVESNFPGFEKQQVPMDSIVTNEKLLKLYSNSVKSGETA